MAVLRQLLRYLWPEGEPALRARVVVSLVLLLGAKVCSVYVPFMFKNAVDLLNVGVDASNVAVTLPLAALIGCQWDTFCGHWQMKHCKPLVLTISFCCFRCRCFHLFASLSV